MLDINWTSSALALAIWTSATVTLAEAPKRVVSINLCTDQMAMLLAPPEQLISISFLSRDPVVSAMAETSLEYDVNHGSLEEVVSLQPDLVLLHEWTSPFLENALYELDIKTEKFATPRQISEIPNFITQMGNALGREKEAKAMAREFGQELDALKAESNRYEPNVKLANYGPNGWVAGTEELSTEFIKLSKFFNIAEDYDLAYGGFLSLEDLVNAQPDLVLLGATYPAHSQAEALLAHPAIKKLTTSTHHLKNSAAWSCGLPQSTTGLAELLKLRGNWS